MNRLFASLIAPLALGAAMLAPAVTPVAAQESGGASTLSSTVDAATRANMPLAANADLNADLENILFLDLSNGSRVAIRLAPSSAAATTMAHPKSKTLATWLALLLGSLGLHRLYLHGPRDLLAWLHPLPTLAGLYGMARLDVLGQDDRLAWLLLQKVAQKPDQLLFAQRQHCRVGRHRLALPAGALGGLFVHRQHGGFFVREHAG